MILDDIVTVGGMLVSIGLSFVAVRQQSRIQELEGFRRIQEEMQARGCSNVHELDQAILAEIKQAEQQKYVQGPVRQQKAIAAPKQEPRRVRVPVKGTARPYNAELETDDIETVQVTPRRRRAGYPQDY